MPTLSLHFQGVRELSEVRAAMVEVACGLHELPIPELELVGRREVRHPAGWNDDALGQLRWVGERIELRQEVEPGPGNPRDGWGYSMTLILELAPDPETHPDRSEPVLTIRVQEADWAPRPKYVNAVLSGDELDLGAYDRARALLRARFGEASDRCDHLWIVVGNARAMLELGDRATARSFLERAVETGDSSEDYWREQFAKLRAELGMASPP
jgi:hypothetical protein